MEIDERRILEMFLGLIFVALLVVIVVLALYLPDSGKSSASTSNVISNSYNSNSFNEVTQIEKTNEKIYSRDFYTKRKVYTKDEEIENYLEYSSYGEHSREETLFSNYRDEFRVYVVNNDYKSGYFKVKFYFCDYYDECFSETLEKYISSGEEKEFYFVDVHEGKYEYYSWGYKVFPEKV